MFRCYEEEIDSDTENESETENEREGRERDIQRESGGGIEIQRETQ